MVPDAIQDTNQAVHNVALAAWVGGAMFGKFAHNPALREISSRPERGKVANAAWNGWSAVNILSLAAIGGGHTAGRLTELRDGNLGARERPIMRAIDALTAATVASGAASALLGARLARQEPGGAVPVESGTVPAPETPPAAARIQRVLGVLGTANVALGAALVAANGLFWRSAVSRPPKKRALRRRGF